MSIPVSKAYSKAFFAKKWLEEPKDSLESLGFVLEYVLDLRGIVLVMP